MTTVNFLRRLLFAATILVAPLLSLCQPAPCGKDPDMTSFCADACVICDIDGYTGINSDLTRGQAPPGFCTSTVHHMQWIAFIAGSEDLTISVSVSNCNQGSGLEVGIYESLDCENFRLVSNCNGDIREGQTGVFQNTVPLVIGQYYYFVMDGNMGDVCNYTIRVISGSTQVSPLAPPEPIEGPDLVCMGDSSYFTLPEILGANFVEWYLDGTLVDEGYQTQLLIKDPGLHHLCALAFNVCDTTDMVCKEFEVVTAKDTFIFGQICENECFMLGDSMICDSGDYQLRLPGQQGCDSIVNLHLSFISMDETAYHVELCASDSFFLEGQWYHPPGDYMINKETSSGCSQNIRLILKSIECDIEGSISTSPVYCKGDSTGSFHLTISGGMAPFHFFYQQLGGTLQGTGVVDLMNVTQDINFLPAGTYLITVEDNFNHVQYFQAYIEESELMTASVDLSSYSGYGVSCYESSDGFIEIEPQGGNPPYQYNWTNGITRSRADSLPSGNYSILITDAQGCSLNLNTILTQPEALYFTAEFQNPDCYGESQGSITILNQQGGVAPFSYSINGQLVESNLSHSGLSEGNYVLSITDANNCSTDTAHFISQPIIPNLELGDDITIELGDSIIIQPTIDMDPVQMEWSPVNNLDCQNCLDIIAYPYENTTYTLTVWSEDGCSGSDSITLWVEKNSKVYAPNAITPNFDGKNDKFILYGDKSVTEVKEIKIFSRWGNLLFSAENLPLNQEEFGWDGTFNGIPVDLGVYTWVAKIGYIDGRTEILGGDLTVIK
ncbi:MAG: gliding motility-associated C-terminal domain-containing protein [Saprospiraceae bacterium]|nr:gliding motility-associated C-terminal domain-containing protein [Saprospiraceae bacterium]